MVSSLRGFTDIRRCNVFSAQRCNVPSKQATKSLQMNLKPAFACIYNENIEKKVPFMYVVVRMLICWKCAPSDIQVCGRLDGFYAVFIFIIFKQKGYYKSLTCL